MATPNFILALMLMLFFHRAFGVSVGGLLSQEFQGAPWSLAKLVDLLKHLPIPIMVIGTAGTAVVIRTLRAPLLDELRKQYVITARSKGVEERRLVMKYPVRIAVNPMISSMSGIDMVVSRIIEFLQSLPTIPLWMALAAALPPRWSPIAVYAGITVILSIVGWTGLARVVRGKFLELREQDFVLAAHTSGASTLTIIRRHLVPSFLSYLIVNLTLSIPTMILGETSLSYLGLGLRPPIVSWGVLLEQAQNFSVVALYPWLMIPALFVIVSVLALQRGFIAVAPGSLRPEPIPIPNLHEPRGSRHHVGIQPAAAGAVRVAHRLGMGNDVEPSGDLDPRCKGCHFRAVLRDPPVVPRVQAQAQRMPPVRSELQSAHGQQTSARAALHCRQAAGGVVIGQGGEVETPGTRGRHQVGHFPGTVGVYRVGMQITEIPARAAVC